MAGGERGYSANRQAGPQREKGAPQKESEAMTAIEPDNIPPCQIRIQKDGKWFHKGREMIHREFIRLFYQNMKLDEDGRYLIHWDGKPCYVEVEDTAFVVMRVDVTPDGKNHFLTLSDDSQELLDPTTLTVNSENVMYCEVKNGTFPARFTRPAYYQLARLIQEDDHGYYITVQDTRHYVGSA
jgi:hypothetical protein